MQKNRYQIITDHQDIFYTEQISKHCQNICRFEQYALVWTLLNPEKKYQPVPTSSFKLEPSTTYRDKHSLHTNTLHQND